ncbi:MAG: hypothetical protein HY591_06205 [Candidatus Omnitrophica bacterium]|nr:hypothetical protein [Candidatus Omnitrophota bacterium]
MKRALIFTTGFILLTFGMALVLRHWDAAIIVFTGIVPAAMAVAGLVMMFAASIRPKTIDQRPETKS